jgi:hypothetical protein
MEVQKEAFSGLMEYYKLLPIENKRNEIFSVIEELISNYSLICTKFGVITNMSLNKEILNIKRADLTEEEFMHALFAYLNTLQDVSAQFINKMSDVLKENSFK